MSKRSKLVVTLTRYDIHAIPVEDGDGNLIDLQPVRQWEDEYHYARRDYPRGPLGKAELIADLVKAFESEGLEFSATGNDWAAQPDGPYQLFDTAGTSCEVSMHFAEGTPAWVVRAVMELAR